MLDLSCCGSAIVLNTCQYVEQYHPEYDYMGRLILGFHDLIHLRRSPWPEWLRTLIFSILVISVGSSLARVTCETNQVLFVSNQVVFLRDPFLPHLATDLVQNV